MCYFISAELSTLSEHENIERTEKLREIAMKYTFSVMRRLVLLGALMGCAIPPRSLPSGTPLLCNTSNSIWERASYVGRGPRVYIVKLSTGEIVSVRNCAIDTRSSN